MPRANILPKTYLDLITQHISYDPKTGSLLRDGESCVKHYPDRSYGVITLTTKTGRTRQVRAARVAWFLYHGTWTTFQIHYENRDPSDLRIENLALQAEMETPRISRGKHANNRTSRFKGVSWVPSRQCWIASVTKNHKRHYLGSFQDETEAAKAYNKKAQELYGACAHLNAIKR